MRAIQGFRPDAVTWSVLALAAAALAMRLVDLDARPMHHDESLHATFAWYFAEGRGYLHDPLMHGPLQFHVLAGAFRLFGESEVISRFPSALAGAALVAAPLLLRRRLGTTGVVVAAALLALSPVLLYYSRFARNDLPFALFTTLFAAAVWRYREQRGHGDGETPADGERRIRGGGWLLLAAAALALSFTTKETAYLTAAMLLLYLDAAVSWRLVPERLEGGRRLLCWAALLPAAWALVALWPLAGALRRRWGLGSWSSDCDLLVVVGTLTATQIAAFAQLPLEAAVGELTEGRERVVSVVAITVLVGGAAAVGLLWNRRWWLAAAAVFAAIYVPLYTTLGTNPGGLHSGLWGSLDYWLAQQDVQRGQQPGFYYAFMLPLYEPLALAAGVVGGAWLLARGHRLARLLAWWFVWMFVSLSLAGEKMPWLTVHLALPLILLSGLVAGEAVSRLRAAGARAAPAGPRRLGAAGAAAVLVLALGLLTLRTGTEVSYLHPATPVEPLIYTQTSPDVAEIARELAAYGEATGTGLGLPIMVETTASLSWPWAWYLRDYSQVLYATREMLRAEEPEPGRVLIATSWTLDEGPDLREAYGRVVPYRHRSWFPERRYKSASVGSVLSGIADGSLLQDWWQFLSGRIDESAIGSLHGEVLFPESTARRAAEGAR